ncbi:MAG: flagellin [Planctomycetota bacterium]|nr:flagellin [Planctomycetota bacterium]
MLSSYFPVFAGRVSDQLVRGRAAYQIQSDQASLQKLQTQLSTGLKFQKISEDPTAAIKVLGIQESQRAKQQQLVNLSSAEGYLKTTESALASGQDILNAIKSIGIEGASNLLSDTDRSGLLAQIDGYLSILASISNQKSQDRFLFTGGDVSQQPISLDGRSVRFNGNDTDLLSIADSNSYLAHNLTGQDALGLISESVSSVVDLNPVVTESTRLSDLLNGRGVGPVAIQLSDGVNRETIDLESATVLGDVIDRINATSIDGRPILATLTTNGLQIDYADGLPGTLRVLNVGAGKTASDLSIATTDALPVLPIVGGDLDPVVRGTTRLADLNGGLGLDVSGGLTIRQGDKTHVVDFAGTSNVEDLLSKINSSGAGVLADIAPGSRSIRIRSIESGTDFSISESTGTLASQLGLKTFSGATRLSDLNYGYGIELAEGNDLTFTRSDGTQFGIDLQSAVTIQDAIDLINNSVDNADPLLKITASLNPTGNGLVLKAPVPIPPDPLPDPPPISVPVSVATANGSGAATLLGLTARDASQATGSVLLDEYVISGRDTNPQEVKGAFNSILRLRKAIADGNTAEVGRASEMIDRDIDRLSFTRGELGIRLQRIDSVRALTEDNMLQLKIQESDNRDVDFASFVTELNARQAAYEANLRLLVQANQQSIFSYL